MKTETNFPLLNLLVIQDEMASGKPTLRIEKIKSKAFFKKPLLNYYYRSEEDRAKALKIFLDNAEARQADRLKRKSTISEAKKNMINPFKVGDVLYDSWGYDQTNIDFYQVVEVLPKSIKMQRIKGKHMGDCGFMSNYVAPAKDEFMGEPITKILQVLRDGKIYVNSRHGWISKWDREKITESHYA